MDVPARLTSRGRVTLPKPVRDALGLEPGDTLLFRVEHGRAVVSKNADFIDLAGAVDVPAGKRAAPWPEVRLQAWEAQTADRRRRVEHS